MKHDSKKAFITGIAGFIGSHLADTLIENGWQVYGLDNLLTGSTDNLGNGILQFFDVDIRSADAVHEVIKQVRPDYIFHLAAIARTPWTIDDPRLCHDTNITGTFNVLEAARELQVKKVVFASSNIVYSEKTPYYISKKTGELYMRVYDSLYNLPTISLRFSNVYGSLRQSEKGPAINVLASLRKSMFDTGYITITGDGEQSRDFTHVRDICKGLLLAAITEVRGQEIDLCTGRNFTMNEVAQFFPCPVKYIPDRPGDIKHIVQDPTPAKDILGFVAQERFEDNIHIYTDGYK